MSWVRTLPENMWITSQRLMRASCPDHQGSSQTTWLLLSGSERRTRGESCVSEEPSRVLEQEMKGHWVALRHAVKYTLHTFMNATLSHCHPLIPPPLFTFSPSLYSFLQSQIFLSGLHRSTTCRLLRSCCRTICTPARCLHSLCDAADAAVNSHHLSSSSHVVARAARHSS